MEFIYAELNEAGRVKAVTRAHSEIVSPTMVRIAAYDEALLGAVHTGADGEGFGVFEEPEE